MLPKTLLGSLALLILAALAYQGRSPRPAEPPPVAATQPGAPAAPTAPEFVGRAACAGCHAEQDRLWQGSHHDLAMQEANEGTVLGNFADTEFRKDGVVSRFFRQAGQFMVRTDGPDGKLADFQVKYTFGVAPLQQYLVELPGGRLQALSIAWDSRPKAQGGQRWFHLYPNEKIGPDDELHWTRLSQNWNYMCAECHSTDLRKNYDAATHGYRTSWAEIDVSCEACHGPASRHLAWARAGAGADRERLDQGRKGLILRLDERRGVAWAMNATTGNARRDPPRTTAREIEMCARCHSRRGQWFPDYTHGQPLLNTHRPALLEAGLYHADGQIDGEVYEYGSFLQSRMNAAGVTCSDCHEPHSLKLRAEGNGVCLQCHGAAKYDTPQHHRHPAGGAGAQCVDCHMPAKVYMVVDPRRDHSLRVPRPDLAAKLGTPDACTGCHAGKPPAWAASRLRQWFGHDPRGFQDYAETLHAARTGALDAEVRLTALLRNAEAPAIARATAATELGRRVTAESFPALAKALADGDPLVRNGALGALDGVPPEQRWQAAHDLLRDPLRVNRAEAAGALAGAPASQLTATEQADWGRAAAEYQASLRLNGEVAATRVNEGNFLAAQGDVEGAARAYREALALDAGWVPATVNLSDLYRQTGRDEDGEAVLREGLAHRPQAAALHHALGLLRVRQRNLPAALEALKRAVELAPDDTRFRYVYAVALDSGGRNGEARKVVAAGLKRAPGDPGLRALDQQLRIPAR